MELVLVQNIVGKNKNHKHQLKCRKVKHVETWEEAFYKKILLQKYNKKEIKRQFYLPGFDHPYDFAIPKHKLLIEIDGNKWHETKKARKRDAEIDTVTKEAGWELVRYHDEDLEEMGIIKAKKKKERISWDQYFINICFDVSKRSTCLRRQIGCVIVNDNCVISTGYNGAPSGFSHCQDIGCLRDELKIKSGTKLEICRGVHAEMNALLQSGKNSTGGVLYVNCFPCVLCAKLIINGGIKKVVVSGKYSNTEGIKLLRKAKITVKFI